ncbi:MAG TPA: hypothetical protein VMC43_01235 [Candidatus Paceibacterota bacterium]|nr:hypothetical protein [Candidatus Paceibacterota bacterium]
MNQSFWSQLKRHQPVALAIGVSFVLVLAGWIWAYTSLRGISQPLIIHYNAGLDSPVEMKGTIWDIFDIGGFGVLVVVLNGILAVRLDERDWFLGKLIAGSTFVFAVLIFIAFSAIISVN